MMRGERNSMFSRRGRRDTAGGRRQPPRIVASVIALIVTMSVAAAGPSRQAEHRSQATAPPAASASTDAFNARLEEIDRRALDVKDLRADFEQRKHTTLLKKPLVSSGTVAVKGDATRWDTRSPRVSVMASKGAEIRVYYPAESPGTRGVVEIYNASGELDAIAGSPLPRLAALRRQFTLSPIDVAELLAGSDDTRKTGEKDSSAPRHDHLIAAELIPIHPELRAHVERVRVLIDASTPCLLKMQIVSGEGERTEIEFRNVKVNSGVTVGEVELRVPDGTREVRPMEMGSKTDAASKDNTKK